MTGIGFEGEYEKEVLVGQGSSKSGQDQIWRIWVRKFRELE